MPQGAFFQLIIPSTYLVVMGCTMLCRVVPWYALLHLILPSYTLLPVVVTCGTNGPWLCLVVCGCASCCGVSCARQCNVRVLCLRLVSPRCLVVRFVVACLAVHFSGAWSVTPSFVSSGILSLLVSHLPFSDAYAFACSCFLLVVLAVFVMLALWCLLSEISLGDWWGFLARMDLRRS